MNPSIKDIFDAPDSPGNPLILGELTLQNNRGRDEKEYALDEDIDTEPLPHTPGETQENLHHPTETTAITACGEVVYPVLVQGSPIREVTSTGASSTALSSSSSAYNNKLQANSHHHNIQHQMSFGTAATTATSTMHSIPMMWGQANPSVRHPGDKPKRPLSAYNFFFQLERERIIKSDDKDRHQDAIYTVDDVARVAMEQQRKAKENAPKEKRSHRKTHGKISFGDLARTIANKWKKLDDQSKAIFEGSAAIEKERYRKELTEWNLQQKKWKEANSKMASAAHRPHSMMFTDAYGVVTPPQLPKKTVLSNRGDAVGGATSSNMMEAIMSQQKILNDSSSASSARSRQEKVAGHGMVQQQPRQRVIQGKQLNNGVNNCFEANRRYSTGMMAPYGSNFQHSYGAMSGMDYASDMYNLQNMYNAQEDEDYYMNDSCQNNTYDYDDMTDETYHMAQMTLPKPRPNAFHRMMMINQRRMRMMMMMQQRQQMAGMGGGRNVNNRRSSAAVMRQQMMMTQAAAAANPYVADPHHFDHAFVADDQPQQQQAGFMEQHTMPGSGMADDVSNFMDPSTHAFINSTGGASVGEDMPSFEQERPSRQGDHQTRGDKFQEMHTGPSNSTDDRESDFHHHTDTASSEDPYHPLNMLHGGYDEHA